MLFGSRAPTPTPPLPASFPPAPLLHSHAHAHRGFLFEVLGKWHRRGHRWQGKEGGVGQEGPTALRGPGAGPAGPEWDFRGFFGSFSFSGAKSANLAL